MAYLTRGYSHNYFLILSASSGPNATINYNYNHALSFTLSMLMQYYYMYKECIRLVVGGEREREGFIDAVTVCGWVVVL